MGFLPFNKAPEAIDQKLCQDLWNLVKGEEIGGVSWDTLRVVFLTFIGIKEREKAVEGEEEPHQEEE